MHLTTYFENCLPVSDTMIPVHEVSLDYRDGTHEDEGIDPTKATFLGLKSLRAYYTFLCRPVVLMIEVVQASNHLRKLEIYGIENIGESFSLLGQIHISNLTHFTCESSDLTPEVLHRILQAGTNLHAVRICEEKLHACTTAQFEKLPSKIKHLELIDCKIRDDVQTFIRQKYPRIASFAHHEHSH